MLTTVSRVAVAITIDLFCRKTEGLRTDVLDSACRATGKAAWNLPSVSIVVGSCLTARSRRFNTRRFMRVVESLDITTISISRRIRRYHWQGQLTNTFINVVVVVFSKGYVRGGREKKLRLAHQLKKRLTTNWGKLGQKERSIA